MFLQQHFDRKHRQILSSIKRRQLQNWTRAVKRRSFNRTEIGLDIERTEFIPSLVCRNPTDEVRAFFDQ